VGALPAGLTPAQLNRRFIFFAYTIESGIYGRLNQALRERHGPRFDAWAPYLWHLSQALRALPSAPTTIVYRCGAVASLLAAVLTEMYLCTVCSGREMLRRNGARLSSGLDAPNLDAYQLGRRIHWSGFSSTSTEPAVASRPPFYHGPPGVVFRLKVHDAKDIQPFR
jgi:hypothetical protein